MNPFQTYNSYVSVRNHFTQKSYDYFKYNGKCRVNLETFNKRKDKYFFEKISRKLKDSEVVEYFVSNFISSDNPSSLWVGEIARNGQENYSNWKRRTQSMTYMFKNEFQNLIESYELNELFDCCDSHPIILKKYMLGEVSPETMVILDATLNYIKQFDKKLSDPVWAETRNKILKYKPFLSIDKNKYVKIMKEALNV